MTAQEIIDAMERHGLTLRRLMPTDDQGKPRTARWICKVTGRYWGNTTHWGYHAYEGATASEAVERALEHKRLSDRFKKDT